MKINHFNRLIIAMTMLLAAIHVSEAAEAADSTTRLIHRLGLDLRGNYVASSPNHERYDFPGMTETDDTHASTSAHLKYSFSFSDATRLGRLYPGAYQGIGLSVTSFFRPHDIGTPITAYLFQGAPIVRLSDKLSLDYEWNFGASFGWKKYDETLRHTNIIVGSKVNAYLNVGFLVNYRVAPGWNMTAGLDMSHFSNGNTSWPNPGVNSIGARVGITYTLGNTTEAGLAAMPDKYDDIEPHFSYDLVVYGAVRKRMLMIDGVPSRLPGRFGIGGVTFAPMWNFNRYFRAGVAADIQYDESSDLSRYHIEGTYGDEIKFRRPPFFHQVTGGLSARGELVMPIFSINAGIGYNVIGNRESRNLYQSLALKIDVARSVFLHVGYRLNRFKNPENLMIGIGYRFNDHR